MTKEKLITPGEAVQLAEEHEKKMRKSPVPQSAEHIKEGALKLSFGERVNLRNALNESINKEIKADEERLAANKALLNSKQ